MRPDLPPDLATTYRLGTLCARGHDWQGTGKSLRKRSNGGCRACQDDQVKRSLPRRRPRAAVGALPPVAPRPALPPHLAQTAFLSPITCDVVSHRYREHPELTLRFVASELCCMCVAQTHPLAGD